MLEEIHNLQYFLNHWCVHAPLSHVRLCLSLSILPFDSMKVGGHIKMLCVNNPCIVSCLHNLENVQVAAIRSRSSRMFLCTMAVKGLIKVICCYTQVYAISELKKLDF